MADRFPLILNTSTNQIQEIASGDQLDLSGNNIANAGIITATSFSGHIVAGAGTSNIVAGIITATQLDLNGDIDVDGHTNLDNLSVAGVSTFAGNADFSSGVDVTGNIIATGEIQCKDISLIDTTPKITFFDTDNNPDYTISANSGSWRVTDSTSSAERLVVNSDGHVDVLGNLDVGAGIDITGNVIASGNVTAVDGTFSGNVSIGGTLTYEDVTNIDSVGIITARNGITVSSGTATFQGAIDANGDLDVDGHTNLDNVNIVGVVTVSQQVHTFAQQITGDNQDSLDFTGSTSNHNRGIAFNGKTALSHSNDTWLRLNNNSEFTSGVYSPQLIRADGGFDTDGNTIVDATGQINGTRILTGTIPVSVIGTGTKNTTTFYRGDGTFQVVNTDLVSDTSPQLGGNLDTNDKNIVFGDSSGSTVNRLNFGAGTDLSIRHDGTDTIFSNSTGDLYINNAGTNSDDIILSAKDDVQIKVQDGETGIQVIGNGAVELYHDNSKKFATTSTGCQVANISNNGGLLLSGIGNNTGIQFTSTGGSPNNGYRLSYHSVAASKYGDEYIAFDVTDNSGNYSDHICGFTNDGLHFPDNKTIHLGGTSANGDLKILHDGNNSFITESGTGDLYLTTNSGAIKTQKNTGENMIVANVDGAVELYNDNALKLATTSTGVAITGIADATGNSARFRTIESGGATVEIRSGGAEGYIGTQTGHKISFITSGNRTMTLLANKSLCIGLKGTTGNTSPTSVIGWELNDGWTKGVFSNGVGGNTPWTLYNEHSSYNRYMAYIRFDGGVMSHQSNDGNLCDERIKQDFDTVSSQWDNIKNIGLKKFRYKNEPSDAKLKIGVIAQQVETIYPDLVDEDWPIGDADPNTHEKNSGDFYKSVKEEQLQMYSLKALQEAMARIETLEAEVAALKGS